MRIQSEGRAQQDKGAKAKAREADNAAIRTEVSVYIGFGTVVFILVIVLIVYFIRRA